jgi:uncharacterized lipoprotein YajG
MNTSTGAFYRRKNMKLRYSSIPLVAIVLLLAACGPYLSRSMEVPDIAVTDVGAEVRGMFKPAVTVEEFVDSRESPVLVDRKGEQTEISGSIGKRVSEAIETALERKGFQVGGVGPIFVRGEVLKWKSDVDSTMQGRLNSEAQIGVQLYSSAGRRVYSGVFNGSASSESPVISNTDVSTSLGKSMAEAIEQFLTDQDFLNAAVSQPGA